MPAGIADTHFVALASTPVVLNSLYMYQNVAGKKMQTEAAEM
jgi:hypothetical protein